MKINLNETTAHDIMTRKVISLEPGTPVRDIFKLFSKNNIMGAPVVDKNNKVIGIVTERDIVLREEELPVPASINLLGSVLYLGDTEHFERLLKKKMGQIASDVMTAPAFVIHEDMPLHEILEFMDEKKVNRLPVIDVGEKLVGIVTRTDIIRNLAKRSRDL